MSSLVINKMKYFYISRKLKLRFYVYYPSNNNIHKPNHTEDLQLKIIKNTKELIDFSNYYNFSINEVFKQRMDNDSILCVLIKNGDWVSYGWIAYKGNFWISEINWKIKLDTEKKCILYDFFTSEKYRGNHYYSTLLELMYSNFDFNEFYIYCLSSNKPSSKGIERAKFEYLGTYNHYNKKIL